MKVVLIVAAVLICVIGAADAYIRLAPINPDRYAVDGLAKPPGNYPETGGFQAARTLDDPQAEMEALDGIIAGTARTTRVRGSAKDGYAAYVTRSALWGFPDVTTVWVDGDSLQIRGHLVFGKSDLGVNKARIEGWLDEAGL
ncbi:DUF1499 domain-containing protein [Thioclava sp. BHET1]|nr:DUF1499 domain-containing protein [Thioclava sp. BHET1]